MEVRAVSGPLKVNKAVLTDANGRYTITELPAGKISVASNKVNYVRANYGQTRVLGPGTPVDLANGQVLDGINFALQRTGVIAGRILDEVGDPVADVQVMPGRYVYFNGERRLQNAGASASTDDLGEYRVFGIPPGTYVVSADDPHPRP